MRRHLAIAAAVVTSLAVPAAVLAHELDHPVPPTFSPINAPLSTTVNKGGEGATWELLNSIPTVNPHSDLDFFTQGGDTFASVGVLGTGPNGGGQTIVKLTTDGEVTDQPGEVVTSHPSAACPSLTTSVTGLQHDVEATPKGNVILNTQVPKADRTDAQLLLDATDAAGRCHDNGEIGLAGAGYGGLEIVDITGVSEGEAPDEIALTSHIGESHTVNVDPRRPHIAYSVTSDSVGVDENGVRENETDAASDVLDGFEVVNLRSCLEAPLGTIPAGTPSEEKRALCKPQVYRFRYPSTDIVLGHTNRGTIYGCHELEVYPDDRLTCGSGSAMIVFDIKDMFDDNGTPDNFLDDEVNSNLPDHGGLPCQVRASTSATSGTGAMITDCVEGGTEEEPIDLKVKNWLEIGSPGSVTGVKHVGSAFHMGRSSSTGAADPAYGSLDDIDFDHEAEFTESRKFILATDERGGGVTIGAQCTPGVQPDFTNGGLHAYAVDRLQAKTPQGDDAEARAAEAFKAYALDSGGKKAVFRTEVQTPPEGSFCTAHVFQQIPGQNRIFMGWYSQGTQVVDFTENADGTVDFERAGYFIPEGANQWVSAIYRVQENDDGTFTYWGATGDGVVGPSRGRNGIDLYKVTLPAPPKPGPGANPPKPGPGGGGGGGGNTGGGGGTPNQPTQPTQPNQPTQPACQSRLGILGASAKGRGRNAGVRFNFRRRIQNPVTVDIFRQSAGRKVIGERLVRRFRNRTGAFTWNGRDRKGRRAGNGYYFARLRMRTETGRDTVRLTLGRSQGRFGPRRSFYRRDSCGTVRSFKLSRPVFGGRDARALGISYRLNAAARVQVTVTNRRERVVRRFEAASVSPGQTRRLTLPSRRLGRGDYRVKLTVTAGGRTTTATLTARNL